MKRTWMVVPAALVLAVAYKVAQGQKEIRPESTLSHVRILFENDRVRVSEFEAKPGVKVGMRSQPDHVIYPLKGCQFKQTTADGKTVETELKQGRPAWARASDHNVHVVGSRACDFIDVELKEPSSTIRR